jgi:hypothetical protein
MFSTRPLGSVVPIPPPPPAIPLSMSDPRFASNTPGPGDFNTNQSGTFVNCTWSENPTYTDGNQVWQYGGPSNLTISQCIIDWREGPRPNGTVGTFLTDQCFISTVGKTGDHADGMQTFCGPAPGPTIKVTNTCFRSYDTAEAAATYGAGFIGSDAFFGDDGSSYTLIFDNVLILGGDRGVAVHADSGTTIHVNWNKVYFVPTNVNSFNGFVIDFVKTPGTLIIDNWTNVYNATIVNGVIIPGSSIPSP